VASTEGQSDSEEDDETLFPISKIPSFCFSPPEIPNGRFVWNCPGCDYNIDLLNLSPDILNVLPDDFKEFIQAKSWKIKDEPIQNFFFQMVSNHYEDYHLSNISVQGSGTEWYIRVKESNDPQENDAEKHASLQK
jgi:hypothetical protein